MKHVEPGVILKYYSLLPNSPQEVGRYSDRSEIPQPRRGLSLRIKLDRNTFDSDMFIEDQVQDKRKVGIVSFPGAGFPCCYHCLITREQHRRQHRRQHHESRHDHDQTGQAPSQEPEQNAEKDRIEKKTQAQGRDPVGLDINIKYRKPGKDDDSRWHPPWNHQDSADEGEDQDQAEYDQDLGGVEGIIRMLEKDEQRKDGH